MRQEDIKKLNEPYTHERGNLDRRFNSAVGADIPSANRLTEEIFNDLDPTQLGVRWWQSTPDEERILISDYLYQCANAIETNIVEAKIHYLEWLEAVEKSNKRHADIIVRKGDGGFGLKMPPSVSPLDDLPHVLQSMHLCGFFRAVGSSLDCLGSLIIGVLALPTSLRRGSLPNAEKALPKNDKSKSAGGKIQFDFKSFLDDAKTSCGVKDWIEWATQYRNMYVHRGRRTSHHQISAHESPLYDAQGRYIPRATTSERLLKHPDRTDIEAFIKSKDIVLDEEVDTTLQGIFKSCRDLNEIVCEELVSIWIRRRNSPALLDQPIIQWEDNIRGCDFSGYDRNAKPNSNDTGLMNPIMKRRMLAASVFDQLRDFWKNSKWKK